MSMGALPDFEELLPVTDDPAKSALRDRLIQVLNSEEEILPSANSPRGKLWHAVNSPDASVEECADIIQLDTALASRIFRIANSGVYGAQAENISDAVRHLGLKFVREQVFNAGVFKQYSGWILPPEWDLFWLRNIFVARLCQRIAAIGPTNGSEYIGGLIHDIGWLFIATYLPEEYAAMCSCGRPIWETEAEFLPCTHAQLAGAIAARSLLPPRTIQAIIYHHDVFEPGIDLDKGACFQAVILNVCDNIADSFQMDMFSHSELTLEQIQQGSGMEWLNNVGPLPDLAALADEEMLKSQQIFEVFFSNRKFN